MFILSYTIYKKKNEFPAIKVNKKQFLRLFELCTKDFIDALDSSNFEYEFRVEMNYDNDQTVEIQDIQQFNDYLSNIDKINSLDLSIYQKLLRLYQGFAKADKKEAKAAL